jgi:hypothetical protein
VVTFDDVAGLLGDLAGRPVERVVLPDDQWRSGAIDRGMPAGAADFTLGMYRAARRGEFAVTDPLLGSLLGRTPRAAGSVLQEILEQRCVGRAVTEQR